MKREHVTPAARRPIGVDVVQGTETVDLDLIAREYVRLALAQQGIPVVVSRPAA